MNKVNNSNENSGPFFDSFVKAPLGGSQKPPQSKQKERAFLSKPTVAQPSPAVIPQERGIFPSGSGGLADSRSGRSRGIFTQDEYSSDYRVNTNSDKNSFENNVSPVETLSSYISTVRGEEMKYANDENHMHSQRRPNSERRVPDAQSNMKHPVVLSDLSNRMNSRENMTYTTERTEVSKCLAKPGVSSYKVERFEEKDSLVEILRTELRDYYQRVVRETQENYETRRAEIERFANELSRKQQRKKDTEEKFLRYEAELKKINDTIHTRDRNVDIELDRNVLTEKLINPFLNAKIAELSQQHEAIKQQADAFEQEIKEHIEKSFSSLKQSDNNENVLLYVKEKSAEFEAKLKDNFQNLNGRMKTLEGSLHDQLKEKDEYLAKKKADIERRFQEGEAFFVSQVNVFKNEIGNKMDSETLKKLVETCFESKLAELRSEMSFAKVHLNNQSSEVKEWQERTKKLLFKFEKTFNDNLDDFFKKQGALDNNKDLNSEALEEMGAKIKNLYSEIQHISAEFAYLQRNLDSLSFNPTAVDLEERELTKLQEWEARLIKKEEEVLEFQSEDKKKAVLSKLVNLEHKIEKLNGELFVIGKESTEKMGVINQALDSLKEENSKLKRERDEVTAKSKASMQSLNTSISRRERITVEQVQMPQELDYAKTVHLGENLQAQLREISKARSALNNGEYNFTAGNFEQMRTAEARSEMRSLSRLDQAPSNYNNSSKGVKSESDFEDILMNLEDYEEDKKQMVEEKSRNLQKSNLTPISKQRPETAFQSPFQVPLSIKTSEPPFNSRLSPNVQILKDSHTGRDYTIKEPENSQKLSATKYKENPLRVGSQNTSVEGIERMYWGSSRPVAEDKAAVNQRSTNKSPLTDMFGNVRELPTKSNTNLYADSPSYAFPRAHYSSFTEGQASSSQSSQSTNTESWQRNNKIIIMHLENILLKPVMSSNSLLGSRKFCLDEAGFLMDESRKFVLDVSGNMIRPTSEQINQLKAKGIFV